MRVDGLLNSAGLRRKFAAGLLVLLIIVGSAWLAITRPDIESLAVYGYPGIFLIMAASSASIILPLPGFATVIAAGTFSNPLLVGIFAGFGSAIGELTGYLAGCGGRAIIEEKNVCWARRIEGWLRRYGFFALVIFAAIPNPFFDLVGVAAGSLCYPARRFLLACLIGNTIKYTLLAYLGRTVSWIAMGS